MGRKKVTPRRSAIDRTVTGSLKIAIADRNLTDYALGQLAGVDSCMIGRFMRCERDIRGSTIDRLAEALGLSLVERSRPRGRPTSAGRPAAIGAIPGPEAVDEAADELPEAGPSGLD